VGELYDRSNRRYDPDQRDDDPDSLVDLGKRIIAGIGLSAFSLAIVTIGYIQYNRQMAKRERDRKKSK
jgi:hypothetical protein